MYIYDISPILVFITETDGVFCELRPKTEEIVADLNVTIKHGQSVSPFTVSRLRGIDYDRLTIGSYTVCCVKRGKARLKYFNYQCLC